MKFITPIYLAFSTALLFGSSACQAALAETTPANQDILRMHTSLPKKAGDALFSYTVEWRLDDEELYRVTGLSFLNAAKFDADTAPGKVTKKIVTSLKDGMIQLDPHWRGINVTQPDDKPELVIANKAGYSLTSAVFRDYSNQLLSFDLQGENFNAAGVKLGLDLVYAADVDYLEGFTSKKSQAASQGNIEIRIDEQQPLLIKTDGKTTPELEAEIARALSQATLSQTPLFAHIVSKDKRNNKPFDGSEVQLLNLAAKSISIEITDPNLGVLMKFQFKDENYSVKVVEPRFMMGALGVFSLIAVLYFWRRSTKKTG